MASAPISFPADFTWGVSTSAYQIEGACDQEGRGPSIWDTFAHSPGNIAGQETGDVACDHYHRWSEDLDLLRGLGVKAYRFSVSWPRVLPRGRGAVNQAGLDFYERLVDALLKLGIQPFLTLYHWDLPQILQDQGGWPNRETVSAFADYAAVVAGRLGDRVRYWTTHNEPFVAAILGHATGEHAPGWRDPAAALQAAHHLLLSHGFAVPAIRSAARGAVNVGIALNLQPVHAASDSPGDHEAARRFDGLVNRWFLDPLFRQSYPQDLIEHFGQRAPRMESGDFKHIGAPVDFLGVNYYSRYVARHNPLDSFIQVAQVEPEGVERSLMWEIYPTGLTELLERVWRDYQPSSLYITENGIAVADRPDADERVDDSQRISYLRRHLAAARMAMDQGVPLRGYFVWSLLDNFEWALGYAMRFGLVYVDFATLQRTAKASAAWYANVIRSRSLQA